MYLTRHNVLPYIPYLYYPYLHPNYYFPTYQSFSPSYVSSYPSYYNVNNLSKVYRSPEYPAVDVTMFNESAIAFKILLQEASIILDHLADSKEFAAKIMGAAQISDMKEVDRLILTTGIKSNFKTSVNPDGMHLKLWSDVKGSECCKLDLAIRWR